MTKKKHQFWNGFKRVLPYLLTGVGVLGLVFVGSIDKQRGDNSLSLSSFATENQNEVSVDQISELYTVAGLSDSLGLASASDVGSNYVMVNAMHDAGQTSTNGKLEKPSLTDVDDSRGVIEYTVQEGDNIDTIAAHYGVSADQIRWSNGLKSANVDVGRLLYIPSSSGIVYLVKSGDTIDSIVSRYGSSAAEIIALNDLEVSGVVEGARILIKDGSLPENERPEYVAPVRRSYSSNNNYSYTYLGDTANRAGASCNRGLGAGQCTSWAWLKRPDLGFIKANANRWDDVARANGVLVNRSPSAGAVFQTDSGWYGHVGYVESVNSDGSINVSERNYAGCYGVMFSTIPASEVGKFNYIH
ncbi:LysM peptidoglycan-binding domain-containing protein [Candidatus Saccharibacteria bacterium]|nr:LysM peptidoglycan-binding domain-containing protein [Candidatus Saccharibacteria bacterium]